MGLNTGQWYDFYEEMICIFGQINIVRTQEEQEWTATELKNSLRSIEWDVEDLEDTIQIVEKNPTKFRIDGAELAVRKGFIESTKEEVRRMKERLTNQSRGNLDRLANQVIQTFKSCLKVIIFL